ncbi:hypothetical protein BH11BAC3_BH11BAC3_44420 [soil metagenome]
MENCSREGIFSLALLLKIHNKGIDENNFSHYIILFI